MRGHPPQTVGEATRGAGRLLLLVLLPVLGGCVQQGASNEQWPKRITVDSAPAETLSAASVALLPEPVPPPVLPRSASGNASPYTVWGKSYEILPTAAGYHAVGTASWYGAKFHGRATASGEPYDMYAFSAAHKSLPLPTYLRVTNQRNGRQLIVRVNDRGPFHGDRLIDLSYAAAVRLGFHEQGTAPVTIEHVTAASHARMADDSKRRWFLRDDDALPLAAASARQQALQAVLPAATQVALVTAAAPDTKPQEAGRSVHIEIGPLVDEAAAHRLQALLVVANLGQPRVVQQAVRIGAETCRRSGGKGDPASVDGVPDSAALAQC